MSSRLFKRQTVNLNYKNLAPSGGFHYGSKDKKSTCNAGDRDIESIPGLGRSPGRAQSTRVFLPGESPGTEEPGWLQSKESQKFSGLSD